MKNMESLIDKVFQSTLPRRERLSFLVFLLHQKLFQSTLPRRERQDREKMIHVCDNFNPRSREGSDRKKSLQEGKKKISIHAPAKGATKLLHTLRCSHQQISIHAPAKGATKRNRLDLTDLEISIHAPAKGATLFGLDDVGLVWHFNPRSREGSDECGKLDLLSEIEFQSTLPRRERPHRSCEKLFAQRFQSTLPRRERQQICTIFYYDIGISAQYYYIFLNKNNLMNSFKTNFNRFYYIFLVRISLHLHVKLLFAPHNTTLLT